MDPSIERDWFRLAMDQDVELQVLRARVAELEAIEQRARNATQLRDPAWATCALYILGEQ
jgi:hypothetical protein